MLHHSASSVPDFINILANNPFFIVVASKVTKTSNSPLLLAEISYGDFIWN